MSLPFGQFLADVWQARIALLDALGVTVSLAVGAIMLGLIVAVFASLIAVFGPRWARWFIDAAVYMVRGIPALVTMFFVYYGVGVVWGALSAWQAALLALGVYASAQLTEILRGAIQSVADSQITAAKAIGLPFLHRITDVIAPLALRRALPSMVNTAVDVVKATTLVSALGVADLLLTGQQLAARTFFIPQVYLMLWFFYFSVNTVLSFLGRWIEERYRHVVY